ncbi:MAG: MBL fold metallo-hydrolase, partial [Deltaproteobacteria bacterium]|nr:MBL fold metallo-hydrolase [Deltaproteobacteria bacterium]
MTTLFSRDVQVAVLSSGSKGNCTYIGDGRCGVLIDCGLSTKQILLRMKDIGLDGAPIDAVLVTHEHSDHAGS